LAATVLLPTLALASPSMEESPRGGAF
jgi:hypothetical protein